MLRVFAYLAAGDADRAVDDARDVASTPSPVRLTTPRVVLRLRQDPNLRRTV
jgi:hypothetical protein